MGLNLIKSFRESFRFKIILLCIVPILVICFALTSFFVYRHSESLVESLAERGRLLARVLAYSAKVGVFAENADLLKGPTDTIARQNEVVRVSIFNGNGILLYSASNPESLSDNAPGLAESSVGNEFYENWNSPDPAVSLDTGNAMHIWSAVFSTQGYSSPESLFFNETEAPDDRTVIGFIKIVLGKDAMKSQLYGFVFKALLIATITAALASLSIVMVVRGITSPLDNLARGIKAIGTNGASEPVPVDTNDEIGNLARAFNEMSASIEKRKAENFHLEMQLRQAQKLESLGTLAGGIAHDFNNVLTPILGFTQMAMEEVPENEDVQELLGESMEAARRARELVEQILAFSRLSEKRKTPLKLQSIVKEALKLLRASVPTTIAITWNIDPECGSVLADPTDIHSIVLNLGANAYHAMRERGGKMEVILEEELVEENEAGEPSTGPKPGRYAKLSVKDTGEGMDETVLARIFDPYFTTKPVGQGTGMGLSMVHGIVRSVGGSIVVESEPGKGTLFRIFLPIESGVSESVETDSEGPIPYGSERVLVVDDEVNIAYMWKRMLEKLGYRVTARTGSLEALRDFSAAPGDYDVIITDQTMPNMTGEELAEEAMKLRQDIPVILCTGFSEKVDDDKAAKKGIRALLLKPILKYKMATTIREVLRNDAKRQTKSVG